MSVPLSDEVIDAVLDYYAGMEGPVGWDEIYSMSRDPYISKVRKVTMHALRQTLRMSYPQIGRAMGRDHSSVMRFLRYIDSEVDGDELVDVLSFVEKRIEASQAARREALSAVAS